MITIIKSALTLFGKAVRPRRVVVKNWNDDDWSGGGVNVCSPASMAEAAAHWSALRDAIGPLHFGGTEAATVWPHFMDGAVRRGAEVAEQLGADRWLQEGDGGESGGGGGGGGGGQ